MTSVPVSVVEEVRLANVAHVPVGIVVPPPVSLPTSSNQSLVPPPIALPQVLIAPDRVSTFSEQLFNSTKKIPYWLVSFVFHLAVLLVLSCLMIPNGFNPVRNVLFLAWGNADQLELIETSAPVVAVLDARLEANPLEDSPVNQPDAFEFIEKPNTKKNAEKKLEQPSASATPPAKALANSTSTVPSFNARMARVDGQPESISLVASGASHSVGLAAETAEDFIVDRFIEFDLGQLVGAAGVQARRNFEALGEKSVPALIRGLNKSAYIVASCPVHVIEAKLRQLLLAGVEPSLLDYAFENIGRDVPATAPHSQRLVGFQSNLRSQIAGSIEFRERRLADFKKRGLPTTSDFFSKLEWMKGVSNEQLASELSSRDLIARKAAVLEVSERSWSGVGYENRFQLVSRLLDQLATSEEPLKSSIHQALVALAAERVVVISQPATTASATELNAAWRGYWETQRRQHLDRRADSLLKLAQSLASGGDQDSAAIYYQKILKQFPSTPAADVARQKLE